MMNSDNIIRPSYNKTLLNPKKLRTNREIWKRAEPRNMPFINSSFVRGMIVNGSRATTLQNPIFKPSSPFPYLNCYLSSNLIDRVFMAIVGRILALHYNTLYYVSQLANTSMETKNKIMSPAIVWQTDSFICDLSYMLGASSFEEVPTLQDILATFPIFQVVDIAKSIIGSDVSNCDMYVPMYTDKNGNLEFSSKERANDAGNVHVPVIFVEPLRVNSATMLIAAKVAENYWAIIDPPHHLAPVINATSNDKFEWQLCIIAGDVVIIAFNSSGFNLSFAHNAMLHLAAQHNIYYVRCIIAIDIVTMQIHVNHYYGQNPAKK